MARGLTLEDLTSPSAEANTLATKTAKVARRGLTLKDFEAKEETKKERPFEGGSTLKVAGHNKEKGFHDIDTGVPIGEGTAQFLAGAGKRLTDIGLRAKQLVGAKGAQEEIDSSRVRDQDLMEQSPAMFGYAAPDVLGLAPLSGPARVVGRAVNLSSPSSGGVIGALQAASYPTTSDEGLGGELARIGLSGGAGALAQAGGNALVGAVGKVRNAMPGGRGWRNPEQRRLYDLLRENDVPSSIGDLDPRSGWRTTENVLERLPSGRSLDMHAQQAGVRNVIEGLRNRFAVPGATGREGAVIQEGVQNEYQNARTAAGTMFNTVGRLAESDPNITRIRPTGTYQAAQEALAAYPDMFGEFQNQPMVRRLLGLERDTGPQAGLIINPKTNAPFRYDQEFTFPEAQNLRKKLGAWQGKLASQHRAGTLPTGLDAEALAQASRIFGAFDDDLERWGTDPNNFMLNDAWKNARNYFRENVLPFRDPGMLESKTPLIKKMAVMEDDRRGVDPATIVDKVLPNRETGIASDVMDMTSPQGRLALKSALIQKMTDESVNPDLQGLDSAALLRHTRNHGHSGEAVFSPSERQAIENTRDIARAASRSGHLGEGHGESTWPWLLSGGAGVASTAYLGSRLLPSEQGDLSATDRTLIALGVAPLAVMLGSRGMNKYSGSALGKNLHFLNPEMEGALSRVQQLGGAGVRNTAAPTTEEYMHYRLGHRP